MKRKIILCVLAVCCLSACGKTKDSEPVTLPETTEEKPVAEEAAVSLGDYDYHDYVTLGEYKEFEVTVPAVSVTDEEVAAELAALLESEAIYTATEKTTVESGDWINVTYKVLDGEKEVAGYGVEEQELQVGAGTYFDAFEQGLVGVTVGKEVAIPVNVDSEFYDAAIAGKQLTFKTIVHSIGSRNLPEATDEWIISLGEYKSLDEWKAAAKDSIATEKKKVQEEVLKQGVQDTVINNCTFEELPKELVTYQMDEYRAEDAANAESMGVETKDFITSYYGYADEAEYLADLEEYVKESIRVDFALQAIRDVEDVVISDADRTAFVEECMEYYGFKDEKELVEFYGGDIVDVACLNDKVWETLCGSVAVVEDSEYVSKEK